MIPQREIKEKARVFGVSVSTIERDYGQNWLLKNLSSINMALKGGTGIRKVYIENYRFSDDLDFTLLEEIKVEEIKTKVKEAIVKSLEESGISFDEDPVISENENGFAIDVYFRIMQRGPNKTRIKIDITKSFNEKIFLPLEEREIIHPYSDSFLSQVRVYSLEEILAEKIRSLFQRTRPRDLYDVWFLWKEWKKVDKTKVQQILPKKFKFKNVKLDINGLKSRKNNFKKAWKTSRGHQLKNLPAFEKVFNSVLKIIESTRIFRLS